MLLFVDMAEIVCANKETRSSEIVQYKHVTGFPVHMSFSNVAIASGIADTSDIPYRPHTLCLKQKRTNKLWVLKG